MRMIGRIGTAPAAFLALALAGPVLASDTTGQAQQPGSAGIALVLDASGSMNAFLPGGATRFDAARAALLDMVAKLPETTSISLRVYGHKSKREERNCEDTELVLPFGPANERKAEIERTISNLDAQGYTPISLSLERAAGDLAAAPHAANTVILVSDGKETCKADPCAVAKALARTHADLVIHTVGFGVDDGTRRQLQCIASVARGNYYDARSMGELSDKLIEAASATIAPVTTDGEEPSTTPGILTIAGIEEMVEVTSSETGEHAGIAGAVGDNRLELPPGIYGVRLTNGLWSGIEIKSGETTELVPAYLELRNPARHNIALHDPETGDELAAIFQQAVPKVALVPGTYELRSTSNFSFGLYMFGAGQATVFAGSIVRVLSPHGDYHSYGLKSLTTGERGFDLIQAEEASVPAGRYVLFDTSDESRPPVEFEIAPGETTTIDMRP